MKRFFLEFREFISRGNVIDMAVGLVVGSAFTGIVSSLVGDIITPAVGFLIGGLDLSGYKLVLRAATETSAETSLAYGLFFQNILNFLIVSFVIFVLIRQINRFRRKKDDEPAPPSEPSDEIKLLTEIRDLLRERDK